MVYYYNNIIIMMSILYYLTTQKPVLFIDHPHMALCLNQDGVSLVLY